MAEIKQESDLVVRGKISVVGGLTSGFLKANGDVDSKAYYNDVDHRLFTYVSGAQTFTIPLTSVKVISVLLNKAPLYFTSQYTVAGLVVTILPTLVANDEIYITSLIK